jgi:hypothetical protein
MQNALNEPVPCECPRCGNAGAILWPTLGDRDDYRCPTCGDFSIAGTQRDMPGRKPEDFRKASLWSVMAGASCSREACDPEARSKDGRGTICGVHLVRSGTLASARMGSGQLCNWLALHVCTLQ